jgi:LPS O-antigen subunit length determinant protein (WzzB/FepE family)
MNEIETSDIDVKEIIRILWSSKYLISSIVFVFSVLSVLYALSIPNIYTSSSILQLSDSDESSGMSGLANQYGGLASLAGISLPSSKGNKSEYIIETVKSRDFIEHLLEFEGITENLIAAKSYDRATKTIVYDKEIFNTETSEWIREVPSGRSKIPTNVEVQDTYLKYLSVYQNEMSSFIKINFSHVSPLFAKEFLDLVISELNEVTKIKDLNDSSLALEYLQKELMNTQPIETRQSINKLIETQLQTQTFANVRKDYLVSPIETPHIPEIKSSPRRSFICIIGFLIGTVVSIFFVLVRHYLFNKDLKISE